MCDHGWLDQFQPHWAGLVVEQIKRAASGMLVWARVRDTDGCCSSCGGQSRRVHSRYDRALADGPVAGQQVVLRLRVRRFFCDTPDCPVATFAEQVEGLTVKHARRTVLCRTLVEHIGLALAGRARIAPGGPLGARGGLEHPAASGARATRSRRGHGGGSRGRRLRDRPRARGCDRPD